MKRLSKSQQHLLWMSPCYVHRGEVRTARSLARLGFGLLEDNGSRPTAHGLPSDARWHFTPNELGQAAREHYQTKRSA